MDCLDKIAAYLMGCPIRGVILDPIVAMQMGIQGQVICSLLCLILFLAYWGEEGDHRVSFEYMSIHYGCG